jgi:hypothetical protein
MKKAAALIVSIFWTSLCHADVCSDRVMRLISPVFPGTLNAVHTLRNEKHCEIDVAYAINADGKAEDIVSRAERDICTGFKVEAMRAVRASQFTSGEYLRVCYIRVNFRLVEGEMETDYSEVPDYIKSPPPNAYTNPPGYQ